MSSSIIISTDLDGTLLDHNNYSYSAALPALEKIKELKIPLILNSSKTFKEIASINKQLNNSNPYIVENGAAIYPSDANKNQKIEPLKINGIDRAHILDILTVLKVEQGYAFTGFSNMTLSQLQDCTGLDQESAKLAQAREFTEPLLWEGSEESFKRFEKELAFHNLTAIRGGRFIHISSPFDKGIAIAWLKKNIEESTNTPQTLISLGDSENDIPMLECSDYAVLVKSPAKKFPNLNHNNVIHTTKYGPEGWNEALLDLLSTIT